MPTRSTFTEGAKEALLDLSTTGIERYHGTSFGLEQQQKPQVKPRETSQLSVRTFICFE